MLNLIYNTYCVLQLIMSHIKMRKRSNSAVKDPSKKLYDEKAEEVKKFKHGDVE